MSGKLTVQAQKAETELLIKVDRVLTSAGKSFMGKDGNGLHIENVEKQADGSYRINLAIESPALQDLYPTVSRRVGFRGGNGNFNNNGINGVPYGVLSSMPKLVDANGKEYAAAESYQMGTAIKSNHGQVVQNMLLVYRPAAEPAQLTLHGQRTVLFSVPFTLKDVPVQ